MLGFWCGGLVLYHPLQYFPKLIPVLDYVVLSNFHTSTPLVAVLEKAKLAHLAFIFLPTGSDVVKYLKKLLSLDKSNATDLFEWIVREGHLMPVTPDSPRTPRSRLELLYIFYTGDSDDSDSGHEEQLSPRRAVTTSRGSKLERMLGENQATLTAVDSAKTKEEKPKKKKRGLSHLVKRLSTRGIQTTNVSPSSSSSSLQTGTVPPTVDAVSSSGSRSKLNKLLGSDLVAPAATSKASSSDHIGSGGMVPSRSGTKLAKVLGADVGTALEQRNSVERFASPLVSGLDTQIVYVSSFCSYEKSLPAKKLQRTQLGIIPQFLDLQANSLESIEVLSRGYMIATYKNTGTIAFVSPSTAAILFLKGEGKLLSYHFKYPFFLALHDSYQILVYNVELDRSVILYSGFEDIVESPPVSPPSSAPNSPTTDPKSRPVVPPRPDRKSVLAPLKIVGPREFEKPRGLPVLACDDQSPSPEKYSFVAFPHCFLPWYRFRACWSFQWPLQSSRLPAFGFDDRAVPSHSLHCQRTTQGLFCCFARGNGACMGRGNLHVASQLKGDNFVWPAPIHR